MKTQSLRFTDFILDVYPSNFQIALSITSLIQIAYDFVYHGTAALIAPLKNFPLTNYQIK